MCELSNHPHPPPAFPLWCALWIGGLCSFSAAREHNFPAIFGRANANGAPWAAHVAQAVWVVLLLVLPISNFHALIGFFGFAAYVFYGLAAFALMYMRYTQPNRPRPFPVPLYASGWSFVGSPFSAYCHGQW